MKAGSARPEGLFESKTPEEVNVMQRHRDEVGVLRPGARFAGQEDLLRPKSEPESPYAGTITSVDLDRWLIWNK